MRTGLGYLPQDGLFPFGGVDTRTPSSLLGASSSPSSKNMTTFRGSLETRSGCSALAVLPDTGVALKSFVFHSGDGLEYLVVFTALHVYYLDPVTHAWHDITRTGTMVTLPKLATGNGWAFTSGSYVVGQFVYQLSSGAIGQWMTPDGTNYYIAVVSGVFNNTNNIQGVLFNGGTFGTLAKTGTTTAGTSSVGISMNSSKDTFIDVDEGVDLVLGKVMVVTNGVDAPIYWTGVGSSCVLLPVNLTGFCTCKALAIFKSYLVFADLVSTADYEPRTVIWSDTGTFTEWVAGNAGTIEDMDFDGRILRAIPFSDNLILFSGGTIGCLCYLGGDAIFGHTTYVSNIGIIGPWGIYNFGGFIGYIGQDNLYLWDGGRVVTPIGDAIAPTWRSLVKTYAVANDSTRVQRALLHYDRGGGLLWWLMPREPTETTRDFRIFFGEFDGGVVSASTAKIRWFERESLNNELSFGTIRYTQGSSITNFLILGSTGVFVDFQETSDQNISAATTAISSNWQSMDFVVPQKYKSQLARWIEIELEAKARDTLKSITIEYSVDSGTTWVVAKTFNLTTSYAQYRINIDKTSRTLRLRFSSTNYISLLWYRVWFHPGGPR